MRIQYPNSVSTVKAISLFFILLTLRSVSQCEREGSLRSSTEVRYENVTGLVLYEPQHVKQKTISTGLDMLSSYLACPTTFTIQNTMTLPSETIGSLFSQSTAIRLPLFLVPLAGC